LAYTKRLLATCRLPFVTCVNKYRPRSRSYMYTLKVDKKTKNNRWLVKCDYLLLWLYSVLPADEQTWSFGVPWCRRAVRRSALHQSVEHQGAVPQGRSALSHSTLWRRYIRTHAGQQPTGPATQQSRYRTTFNTARAFSTISLSRCCNVCYEHILLHSHTLPNRNLTHTRSTASNLEQVANLLCAQANSAYYPRRDGKWAVVTATGWRPTVANWGDGVSASCTAGPIVR